jgi:predicted nucleic acid-binding protein
MLMNGKILLDTNIIIALFTGEAIVLDKNDIMDSSHRTST